MTADPVLSLSGLTTSFCVDGEWRPVVRDVSFDLMPKETLAVVGESGSGKSITALSIMRLLPDFKSRADGQIRFRSRDLLTLPEAEMRKIRGNDIAMIFQEPMTSLNPSMTIGAQIAETLMWHRPLDRGEAEAETVRLLDRVRIPVARQRFGDYPHRFSGGMRQRVMIAMALACHPSILIADEPTTALDVTIQAQILALIKELQDEENMSVLFITHDMGVVAEIADRTVVMLKGDLVETGDTRDIFARPQHPYTRALLSAVPHLGSMTGRARPVRFPVVDKATGESDDPAETPDTVAHGERPVLEVKHLTTRFDVRKGLLGRVSGRVHAVEDVSFVVKAGETLALVGESGCGKSTIGRSIVQLIRPQGGSVLVDGKEMLNQRGPGFGAVRKDVQMIFQDPFASLNPRMTIGDAIAEPIIQAERVDHAGARNRVSELLDLVGLDAAMAGRYPHEFSGGQRQRICIARALALNPKIIIADESVSALDASVKAQVINLMLDLQERLNLAFLFISHDMAVVERVSHRVAVMLLGEIVEIGPRAAIFENPQHPYTRKLISAVPIPDPARRARPKALSNDELQSPVRPVNFAPAPRQYREVSLNHYVQVSAPDSQFGVLRA